MAPVDTGSVERRHRSLAGVRPFTADDGSRVFELSGRSTGTPESSLALIVHPAGTSSRAHHHTVAVEVYFVKEGGGRIEVAGEEFLLARGDIVIIRPGQVHKLWCDQGVELELLVTCTPAYDPAEVVWDE